MTTSHVPTPERQYGVALPVALIMTLLIALLGMTMLRGGIISELVASNQQQKFISTEAAQSSIESIWEYSYLKNEIAGGAGIAFNNPAPIPQPATATGLVDEYDFITDKGSVDVDGVVTVQYCGESMAAGSSLDASHSSVNLVSALVDVTSRASIGNTNARALVVQRAAITSVSTGREGDCEIH